MFYDDSQITDFVSNKNMVVYYNIGRVIATIP